MKHASEAKEKEEVLTFELQQAFELPHLSAADTNDMFYKRQLWFYNLCVYDEVRQIGYMYVWNESIASNGSQEIASCLYKHFFKYVPIDTRKITLFCDPSAGQNRNLEISLMLKKYITLRENLSIEQHFFDPRHSTNSCNRTFSTMTNKLKTGGIFVPDQLTNLMQQSKFSVVQMSTKDFYSCQPLKALLSSCEETEDGEKIEWNTFQLIK